MYENHYNYVKNKLIKNTVIYLIIISFCVALIVLMPNVFSVLILCVICYFYTSTFLNYYGYMKWIRTASKTFDIAIIEFTKQPHLFFKSYHGHRLPLKQYCIPVNMPIDVVILDKLNVVKATINVEKQAEFDLFITANYEVILNEIS